MCSKKEMSVLVISEVEDVDTGDVEGAEISEEQQPVPMADISLSSIMAISNPKTMKLKGLIEGVEVIIMIDPGAMNNFISHKTVQQLNLPYSTSVKFGVTVGNGERIQGEGECKALCVEVQGMIILEDFLILELGNSGVILGLQWLEKLGETTTDWKKQVM